MKIAVVLAVVAACALAEQMAVSSSMILDINLKQTSWKAAHNHITRMPKSEARKLLGVDLDNLHDFTWRAKEYTQAEIDATPETFDSREQWPNCPSMSEIRDQRHCGSCWAFGAVEAMSDRICAHKNEKVRLSAEDMNSCSSSTFTTCGSCNGGQPGCAWDYWVKSGVVTEDCYPYTAGNTSQIITPDCEYKCTGDPSRKWENDKYKGKSSYTIHGEENIKAEISKNGPIEVAFTVYEDFMTYSSGIYHHVTGSYEGGHAVKMLGYGEENGQKYWICANSWNVKWGEKGYFRIRRGKDECGIESRAWAGMPK